MQMTRTLNINSSIVNFILLQKKEKEKGKEGGKSGKLGKAGGKRR